MTPTGSRRPRRRLTLLLSPAWQRTVRAGMVVLLTLAYVDRAGADMLGDAFLAAQRAVAPALLPARLEIVRDARLTSALAARLDDRVCRIFVLEPSTYLDAALALLEPAQRQPYLEGLFAHEFAHCADQLAADSGAGTPEPPNPVIGRVKVRRMAGGELWLVPVRQDTLWAEILADACLALYLHEHHPAIASNLTRRHLEHRSRAGLDDPDHDTARFLEGLAFERGRGESIREAALRLRRAATAPAPVAMGAAFRF